MHELQILRCYAPSGMFRIVVFYKYLGCAAPFRHLKRCDKERTTCIKLQIRREFLQNFYKNTEGVFAISQKHPLSIFDLKSNFKTLTPLE
jgi:hypothetical protein